MSPSDVAAAYAAVIASGALGWQVFIWRAGRRNRVTVDLKMGLVKVAENYYGPAITIVARNLGARPVRPVAAGLQVGMKGGGTKLIYASAGNLLTRKVPANDSGYAQLPRKQLEDEDVDFDHAMVGWVDLPTGERVKSPSLILIPRQLGEKGNFLPESL